MFINPVATPYRKLAPANEAGIPNANMATRTAVAAPARADQCGFTRSPAIRVNRTMIGRAATSAESHQCPKGSYTCVQIGIVSPDYGRWASFYIKLISEHFDSHARLT